MEQTKRRSIVAKAVREAILNEDPDAVVKLKTKEPDSTITMFGKPFTIPEAEQVVSKIYHSIGLAINLYDMINEVDTINAIDELVENGTICLPEEEEQEEVPQYTRSLDRGYFPTRSLDRFNN